MKIGILLCNSIVYQSMVFDIMDGFNTYLQQNGITDAEIIVEHVGVAGDYKVLQQKAENLLLGKNVKIIVAFIDQFAAKRIEPLLNAANCLLIVAETGGHIPGAVALSPLTFLVSLQSAYGTALAAEQAAKDGIKKIVFVSSYYEGGYGQCYAAFNAWNKNGIAILRNYITPFDPEQINMADLKNIITEANPDAIILQYSKESGDVFLKKYREEKISPQLPIYSSPFMFEQEWITTQPYYIQNICSYVPWNIEINTENNKKFIQAIATQTGKEAGVFHLLGWEAASVAAASIKSIATANNIIKKAADVLQGIELESPRGTLKWNKKHRHWVGPMYEVKMKVENENCMPSLTGTVVDNIEQWEEFASAIPEGDSNRWFNMYLCLS